MKNIKYFIPIIALLLSSCDDYLDVNQNPNQVLYSDLFLKELLPAAQTNPFRIQVNNMNDIGNIFSNSFAGNSLTFGGVNNTEYQLTLDSSFRPAIFEGMFRAVANLDAIIVKSGTKPKNAYFKAVAIITKAHYMQTLVDLYGDVPYTQAFLGADNTTPAYNDDQFIYRSLITSLEQARTIIDLADTTVAEDITVPDVMFHGVMNNWIEFANTLELRMLLRMSNNTGSVAAYRNSKILALANYINGVGGVNPSGSSFLTSDVKINPGYNNSAALTINPLYSYFGFTNTTATNQNRTLLCPSGHIYRALRLSTTYPTADPSTVVSSTSIFPTLNYANVNDLRYNRIFSGTLPQRAITQGVSGVDMFVPGGVTGQPGRLGLGLINPYNQSLALSVAELSANDGYVMNLSEVYFLKCEAGINTDFAPLGLSSTAQSNFDAGINSSFTMLGATGAATYVTAINLKPFYGLAASTTPVQKLHAVMYQKWVSQVGFNGIQTYIDLTRTGFPITPLSNVTQRPTKPKRLYYPNSETISNTANLPSITDADLFTITSKSVFWLQGDPALGN